MNRKYQSKSHQRVAIALGAGLLVASGFASVAQAQTTASVRTEAMPAWAAERLVEKSRQGVDQAMHYLNRTRMIYQLNNFEMLKLMDRAGLVAAPAAPAGSMVADVSPASDN
jgi:hypothetical protein